jgi:CRISPR-associated protein Cst2
MTTIKKDAIEGHSGGAITRVSPIKASPAMGVLPFEENAVVDFLTRRHRLGEGKLEGDIVNVEIGVNLYKCGVAIDAIRVGGEEYINKESRMVEIEYYLTEGERKKRISKILEAIRYLSDYSKQSRLLTDFTPDLILLAFQDIYSHRLQKAIDINDNKLNIGRLEAVLTDVMEYSPKIIAGILPEVIENDNDVKAKLNSLNIEVLGTNDVINMAIENLEKFNLG